MMYIGLNHTSQRSSNLLLHLRKIVSATDRGTTYDHCTITASLSGGITVTSRAETTELCGTSNMFGVHSRTGGKSSEQRQEKSKMEVDHLGFEMSRRHNMIAYKRKTIGRQVRMLSNLCLYFNSTYIICRFFRLNRIYMVGLIRSMTDWQSGPRLRPDKWTSLVHFSSQRIILLVLATSNLILSWVTHSQLRASSDWYSTFFSPVFHSCLGDIFRQLYA
jgi:hypothetical protein